MRRLILIAFLGVLGASGAFGQCVATPTDPCVSINQSYLDRGSTLLNELKATREALDKRNAQSDIDAVTIKAAQGAIDSLQKAIQTGQQIQDMQEKALAMMGNALKQAMELIDYQAKLLNKKPSAWQRFVQVVEKVVVFAAGAAIGKGL